MKRIMIFAWVAALLFSLTTPAFAVKPEDLTDPILFKTEKGTPTVDAVLDQAYKASSLLTLKLPGEGRDLYSDQATATAYTLWDDTCVYLFVDVTDKTPDDIAAKNEGTWNNDSIDIFFDFANDKAGMTSMADSEYAAHIRLMRHAAFTAIPGKGALYAQLTGSGFAYKSAEKADGTGYYIEAAFPHKHLTGTIGFAVQVNDDMNNDAERDADTFVRPSGKYAGAGNLYVLDALNLVGCTATNGTEGETVTYADPAVLDTVEMPAGIAFEGELAQPVIPTSSEAPAESEAPAVSEEAPVESTQAPAESTASAEQPAAEGKSVWFYVGIAVGVVIAAVLVVALSKKKK